MGPEIKLDMYFSWFVSKPSYSFAAIEVEFRSSEKDTKVINPILSNLGSH